MKELMNLQLFVGQEKQLLPGLPGLQSHVLHTDKKSSVFSASIVIKAGTPEHILQQPSYLCASYNIRPTYIKSSTQKVE